MPLVVLRYAEILIIACVLVVSLIKFILYFVKRHRENKTLPRKKWIVPAIAFVLSVSLFVLSFIPEFKMKPRFNKNNLNEVYARMMTEYKENTEGKNYYRFRTRSYEGYFLIVKNFTMEDLARREEDYAAFKNDFTLSGSVGDVEYYTMPIYIDRSTEMMGYPNDSDGTYIYMFGKDHGCICIHYSLYTPEWVAVLQSGVGVLFPPELLFSPVFNANSIFESNPVLTAIEDDQAEIGE